MTSKQKFRKLQDQIDRAERGGSKQICCPYCGTMLDFSGPSALDSGWQPPTCCETFALAVIAILQRKEQNEAKDLAARIRSNAGGQAVFN